MNQKLIIWVVAIIIVAVGVGMYSSNSSKTEMMEKAAMEQKEKDAAMMKPEGAMVKPEGVMVKPEGVMVKPEGAAMEKKEEGTMMVKAGSYEAYSPEKIALAAAKGDVVLFFRALWCPTCRTLDGDINANLKNIPTNLTILIVDYDNSTDLKKKYGVTYQHTLVQVDGNGTLMKKWMGSLTLMAFITDMKK